MHQPKQEILSVRFDAAMLERVREIARATDRSANQVIRQAVRAFLSERDDVDRVRGRGAR